MQVERFHLRLPAEADRERFIELFGDDAFMAFSGGVLAEQAANQRFDRMLANAAAIPYAKQPIIDRASGQIVGYSGVDYFEFEGERVPEYGYRLVPSARGKGYATEAGTTILNVCRESFTGTIYAIIDPTNEPSQRVAAKLGFEFWKQATINGFLDNLYRLRL